MRHILDFPLRISINAEELNIEDVKKHLANTVKLLVDQANNFTIEALAINWEDYKIVDKVEE